MRSTFSRRNFASVACLLLGPLAGCTGSIDEVMAESGCDTGTVSVSAEHTARTAVTTEQTNPLVFGDLPESEEEIVRTAINDGEYVRCFPGPTAFDTLRNRAREHVTEQAKRGGTDRIYLLRDGEYYRLQIRSLDEIVP